MATNPQPGDENKHSSVPVPRLGPLSPLPRLTRCLHLLTHNTGNESIISKICINFNGKAGLDGCAVAPTVYRPSHHSDRIKLPNLINSANSLYRTVFEAAFNFKPNHTATAQLHLLQSVVYGYAYTSPREAASFAVSLHIRVRTSSPALRHWVPGCIFLPFILLLGASLPLRPFWLYELLDKVKP